MALQIVGHREMAEEVIQDSFLRVWNKIGDYDPKRGRLFTWMINIVRHAAIDKLRSREFSQMVKTDELPSYVDRIGGETRQKEETIGVQKWLDLLDDDHRSILQAIYLKGYTQAETSEELGIPIGTVKTRVRNALLKIRKHLNPV